MKPLFILLFAFVICLLITWLIGTPDLALSGRIAMSVMLLFTAMGHIPYSKGMAMMIPPFVPFKLFWVYATGVLEVLAAAGLLLEPIQVITAKLLILFFFLILPANIYAAFYQIDYQKADFNGFGKAYLWFRVPLQLFFAAWVAYFAIYLT